MKTIRNSPSLRTLGAGVRTALLATAVAWAWLAPPLQADVIDDFSGPRKFVLAGVGQDPQWALSNEQLHLTLPTTDSIATFWYYNNTYELTEGRPVEFRLDVVSLNGDQILAGLAVSFLGEPSAPRGSERWYNFWWSHNRAVLLKGWYSSDFLVFDSNSPYFAEPVTMSLTLTRQGSSLKVEAKVVERGHPEHVVFNRAWTDSPGIDGAGDNGSPPPGPVMGVGGYLDAVGGSGAPDGIFDNVVCSADPIPVTLAIHPVAGGGATLDWLSQRVLLEADTLAGPWRPWPGVASADSGHYQTSLAPGAQTRFYRLAAGDHWWDPLDVVWTPAHWQVVSTLPGQSLNALPAISVSGGCGRIRGTGTRNADFVLAYGFAYPPYRDGLASVDIVAWDATMEDASLGIVLRANPGKDLWFANKDGLPTNRYIGLLTFKKASSPSESVLTISGPGGEVLAMEPIPAVDPTKPYRLRFGAVGDQLTLELFENLETLVKTIAAKDGRVTQGCDALYGTKSATGTYDVTIDRYLISATWQ